MTDRQTDKVDTGTVRSIDYTPYGKKVKVKFSHTRFRELGPGAGADPGVQAVTGSRLPLLSARPAVTFPAEQRHRP